MIDSGFNLFISLCSCLMSAHVFLLWNVFRVHPKPGSQISNFSPNFPLKIGGNIWRAAYRLASCVCHNSDST